MLVVNNDIIQLSVVGALQGQEVRNVFHYRISDLTGGAWNSALVVPLWFVDFDNDVLSHLHDLLQITSVEGVNLTNPLQIYEAGVSANGDIIGDCMPSFATFSVKLNRTTSITRNGRKSFSGVGESQQVNGAHVLSAGEVSDIEDFCGTSKTYVIPGSDPAQDMTFNPVIVGRTLVGTAYELDLTKINPISGATMSPLIKTQNTRKN